MVDAHFMYWTTKNASIGFAAVSTQYTKTSNSLGGNASARSVLHCATVGPQPVTWMLPPGWSDPPGGPRPCIVTRYTPVPSRVTVMSGAFVSESHWNAGLGVYV